MQLEGGGIRYAWEEQSAATINRILDAICKLFNDMNDQYMKFESLLISSS